MKIVKGRGANRKVLLELPHASVVNRSSKEEQTAVVGIVCEFAGIKS